jgi:hypothetical protein
MEQGLALGGYSRVYDVAPDRQPVLAAIPEYAGLYADFGWSGHGFKHAPVIGDMLAGLVLRQDPGPGHPDLKPFRWSRFREGDLLPFASRTAPPTPSCAPDVHVAARRRSGRWREKCRGLTCLARSFGRSGRSRRTDARTPLAPECHSRVYPFGHS